MVIRSSGQLTTLGLIFVVSLSAASGTAVAAEVTFSNDVMAVLSKAGCNAGVCHGNQNGKGGFKLSLRGQDPLHDFAALTRDQSGRRANIQHPDRSLILLKPTMQVAHEGGRRFDLDAPEYRILLEWIERGMPEDGETQQLAKLHVTPTERILIDPKREVVLEVEAEFSDGSRRDVSRLAVYEPDNQIVEISPEGVVSRVQTGETTVNVRYLDRQTPVRLAFVPARPDFVWTAPAPANVVDEHVFAKLQALRINPSEICSDAVFLRRTYLDLLGAIPTGDESRQFALDTDPDKRSRLIDELLERPEFADFWALKWSDLLRNEEKTLDRKGVQNFHAWIRSSIVQEKPLDEFVRELIASRGSTYSHPQANYYRAMRMPLMRAESTAQLFLGVRLQCAKCHNHPFDRWTQDDYYGWANLFSRVSYKVLENRRRDRNDKHEFDGEQVVYMARKGDVTNPRTGAPQPPQFLGDTAIEDPEADRLQRLAEWLTSDQNELFARSQANRIWFHLMGRGIVHPIDDFRATNPPVNPALLDALTEEFVESGFDLGHMIQLIMNSNTYQLASVPNDTNRDDETNFSHSSVRRLAAEQLIDSMSQAMGVATAFNGYPAGMRASQIPGVRAVRRRDGRPAPADRFLKLFGKPERLQTCECERTTETTLSQAFRLISGPLLNDMLTQSDNRLSKLLDSGNNDAEVIDELFWTTLSREPSAAERRAMSESLAAADDRRLALEDIAWSLLNSQEFMLRR